MKTYGFIAVSCAGLILSQPNAAFAAMNGFNKGLQNNRPALLVSIAQDDPAQAASNFISKLADRGIGVISKKDMSDEDRQKELRNLLHDNFDMKTIGRFALGTHWKTATKEEQKEYLKLFEDMIVTVYSRRFKDYNGNALNVKSAREDGEKDAIVFSEIVPKNGQKIKVDWRVRNKDGKFSVVDIIVEGVSMSLTQRSEFSSVIQRGGGKMDILLAHLRTPAEK